MTSFFMLRQQDQEGENAGAIIKANRCLRRNGCGSDIFPLSA